MDVKIRNLCYLEGRLENIGLFPQLEVLSQASVEFKMEFGLKELPKQPGLISIRGARQFGKSTWLEKQLRASLLENGQGSAFYLNGDLIANSDVLRQEILELLDLFPKRVTPKRIFIDEITAIENWERTIKALFDLGETRDILIVTTGSKCIDLRHGIERLPGRKGRLQRSEYVFTPISYAEFDKKCRKYFAKDTLIAYLVCGGSPLAANELIDNKRIPEFIVTLIKDWVHGECTRQGRNRSIMTLLLQALFSHAGLPISLARLARNIGVANNTVLQGYLEVLKDLMCLSEAFPIDLNTGNPIPRKSHKFHFINLLAAVCFHPQEIRTIEQFKSLDPSDQGKLLEWLVAQELWRRDAIAGVESPELQYFWQNEQHEVDFVRKDLCVESKKTKTRASQFTWFHKFFPKHKLKVVSENGFESLGGISGVTFEEFLLNAHQ